MWHKDQKVLLVNYNFHRSFKCFSSVLCKLQDDHKSILRYFFANRELGW